MTLAMRMRAVLFVVALLGAAGAHAQGTPHGVFNEHWFGGAKAGIVVTDQDYDNDGTLYALHVGRTFGETYAVELEIATDTLDFGIDYGLKHRSIGLNHLTINREPLWDPYFLIGVGLIEFEAPEGSDVRSGSDVMFNLGIGGQWELFMPNRAYLRADLRLRYDLNDTRQPGQNGFGDAILSFGLVMPFGSAQ